MPGTEEHDHEVDSRDPGEEARSVDLIAQAMVKAAKGMTIYPPGSSFHSRFVEELHRRFSAHLEEYGKLRLEIDRYEIRFGSLQVYENRNPKESLAFRAHSDGIVAIEFRPGLSGEEIRGLLRILTHRGGRDEDDDMVTLLWAAEFPHIAYEADDHLDGVEPGAVESRQSPSDREAAVEKAARAEESSSVDSPLRRETATDILVLTEEESAFLAKAVSFEEAKNPLDDLLDILPAMLSADDDSSFRGEVLEIIGSISSMLLAEGLLDHALALLVLLRQEADRKDVPPELARSAASALESVGSSTEMESPDGFLEAAVGLDPGKTRKLAGLLGVHAVRPFCLLLGRLEEEVKAETVIDAMISSARTRTEVFLDFLSPEDPRLARRVLSLLRRTGSPPASSILADLVAAGDPPLQREVLSVLHEFTVPGGEEVLAPLLSSEKSGVRIQAARVIASRNYPGAGEKLMKFIGSGAFQDRGLAEKKVLFESLGDLGGAPVFDFLSRTLQSRHTFARRREHDEVTCAAAGLQRMATPEALAALRRERDRRKGELKAALDGIIRRLEQSFSTGDTG